VGRGLAAPSPRTPSPLSAFGLEFQPFGLHNPHSKHPGFATGLV